MATSNGKTMMIRKEKNHPVKNVIFMEYNFFLTKECGNEHAKPLIPQLGIFVQCEDGKAKDQN